MVRMNTSIRMRVVFLKNRGMPVGKIQQRLEEEGVSVSKKSLCLLIRKYVETGTVADKKTRKQDVKLTTEHYKFIDEAMVDNPEL